LVPALQIRDLTPAGSRIIMVGCGWNPRLLYYAEREGVMFQDPTPGRFWQTEPIADYPFLFLCAQGVQPRQWLPPGYGLSATRAPGLYKVIRER